MKTSIYKSDAFASLKEKVLPLIQNKVFAGRYTERRYVESLQTYRDIIVVQSNEEIVSNLMQTKEILEAYANNKWIGISKDPQNSESNDCLLWVLLNDVPVGKHWFQMNAVRFEAGEIMLEVKHVQPFRLPDSSFNSDDPNFPTFDLKQILTYENICEAIKFSAVVLMTLFTFTVEALKYLGEYSIKFSHVVVSFIHVSTPICLGMFDFLAKCVGGLYWLIYVLFKGSSNTPVVPRALLSNQRQSDSYQSFRPISQRGNDYSRYKKSYSPNTPSWNKYQ